MFVVFVRNPYFFRQPTPFRAISFTNPKYTGVGS